MHAMQKVELKATKILHLGACDNSAGNYPVAKKKQTLEYLREKVPAATNLGRVVFDTASSYTALTVFLWEKKEQIVLDAGKLTNCLQTLLMTVSSSLKLFFDVVTPIPPSLALGRKIS